MPPSLATVKAEIKTWERAFRAKHDRNPTRDDIKARRDIGVCLPDVAVSVTDARGVQRINILFTKSSLKRKLEERP